MISICVVTILFSLVTLILVSREKRKNGFSKGSLAGIWAVQILTILLSLFHIYGLA